MKKDEQESEAIAKLKRHDIDGLETLVKLYQAQAIESAYIITRDYYMAEDVVQSAFLHVWERIDLFDTNRPFAPWFFRSVINRSLTAVMKRRHISFDGYINQPEESEHDLEGIDLESLELGPDDMLEAAETKSEILAALEKLSPIQRASVVLRYYLDLSDTEVANQLGIPNGTVRRRLHDAHRRLKRLLVNRAL